MPPPPSSRDPPTPPKPPHARLFYAQPLLPTHLPAHRGPPAPSLRRAPRDPATHYRAGDATVRQPPPHRRETASSSLSLPPRRSMILHIRNAHRRQYLHALNPSRQSPSRRSIIPAATRS